MWLCQCVPLLVNIKIHFESRGQIGGHLVSSQVVIHLQLSFTCNCHSIVNHCASIPFFQAWKTTIISPVTNHGLADPSCFQQCGCLAEEIWYAMSGDDSIQDTSPTAIIQRVLP